MSALTEEQMLDVMAWADGELAGEKAARVRSFVDENPAAQELVRSLGALGDFVRANEAARELDIADAVMQRLGPSELERARLKRAARVRAGVVVGALVALAAGVLIYTRTQEDGDAKTRPLPTPPTAFAANAGVEVEQVDTTQSVSVFYVPGEKEDESAPTTVVWIDDKE